MRNRDWLSVLKIGRNIAGSLLLVVVFAANATANCFNGATIQAVPTGTSGSSLINIMATSTKPCTLTLAAGTYIAPSGQGFTIADGITVRGAGAPTSTVLQVTSPFSTVSIWPVGGSCPSGARLENLTLSGGPWGVFAGALPPDHAGCAGNLVSNITLRNLVINTNPTNGHGIDFHSVQHSVIDSCTVNSAYANAIYLESGSNDNIVMNNNVAGTLGNHGIAVQGSSDNVIVGNVINVTSSFDGIILLSDVGVAGPGSLRNRIERNTISGHKVDGIVMTDASGSNYVGLNVAVSGAYVPGSGVPPPPGSTGVGVWVNDASNANYIFANDLSGSAENGIDVLTSKSTLLVANSVHGNWQGGVWVANVAAAAAPNVPAPQDTVLHGNNIFFNYAAGHILLENTINSQVAYNYLSGAQNGVLASATTMAVGVNDSLSPTIFENTVTDVMVRAFMQGATTNARVFRNRFLRGTNIPPPTQTDGRNGLTYFRGPVDVRWDGGSFLGGNYWNEFLSAVGNPDLTHPYTGIVNIDGGPGAVDRFPNGSESLQLPSVPNSMSVIEPMAGAVLAAGTRKTIRWVGRGCSYVNLYYGSGAAAPALIAAQFPNTGFYVWPVPAVAVRSDYYVEVVCMNSNGVSLGPFAMSSNFTVAAPDLVLVNPGRGSRTANGSTIRVAWTASAAVTAVNIFVKAGSGAETQVASNVTGTTFADVVLPASVSNSSRVTVRIQDPASSSRQDSVDGNFSVRGTPAFGTNLAGARLQVGAIQLLDWVGPSNADVVDLDLVGLTSMPIVQNLADFSGYQWFVPDVIDVNAKIRATFKDASGNVIGVAESALFSILRNPGAPVPPAPNLAPARRDIDGDKVSDLVVFRPSTGEWFIRTSSSAYNSIRVVQWGLPGDVPLSGDFDGDGKIDLTVWRPSSGLWYICFSSLNYNCATPGVVQWGLTGDVPIIADFDGDGRSDITVWRPSEGNWYILFSSASWSTDASATVQWGLSGDQPLAGDFDGDGKTDLAVWRPSNGTWYIRYSSLSYNVANAAVVQWGLPGDVPVVGDFDGDGKTELAVWRPSNGTWYIRYSSLGYNVANAAIVQWGLAGDVPVAADFDGDGRAEMIAYRPSTGQWWILKSSTGYTIAGLYQWGLPGDLQLK